MAPSANARAANVAVAAVILLAGTLSTAWVFIVPIFQATDEAAHFDYSISILSAGHLIETSSARSAWIVSPYTRFLLRSTDYFRLAFHSSMRVPPQYGTLAFYRRLDASAPSVRDPIAVRGQVSYIARAYPFGFYLLEALWMKVVALLTGSLVATFFAARILCVFLTMLGLYFNYRTALNIGVPPWPSVALVTAAGFFPLTTLVSSYVQPDNLAYALVSASLYFATQLRTSRRPLPTIAALGLCLGCLAVTKYHFFLSVAIPTSLLVLVRLWHERPGLPAAAARALVFAVPTIVLLRVQLALAAPNYGPVHGNVPSSGLLGSFADVVRSGVEPTIAYLFSNSVRAFIDFFATGPNAATYWGELGLWDAPLVIINEHVELALRIVIALASVGVAVTVAYRILRNSGRLAALAVRGDRSRVALLATNDPVLGSYALFVCLMFGLYVVSDNVFGAAGRHWYPYVFAAFLCAAWYAPGTFRRTRARTPMLVSLTLASYALVASGFATAAVLHRYYGTTEPSYVADVPSIRQIVSGRALGFLWPVQGMDFHPLAARAFRNTFASGARLWAGGSAIFPRWHRAASNVAVVIDDRFAARTIAGQYNFQIAEATRDLTYGYSGFFGAFSTNRLTEGVHVVRAYAKLPDGDRYQEIPPSRLFFLTPGDRFSQTFLQRLRTEPSIGGSLETLERCENGSGPIRGHVSVAAGTPMLARGSVSDRPAGGSVVWLLVDEKPYPARYGHDGRSFSGTIPTSESTPGLHRVRAFAADPKTSRYWRIPGTAVFVTSLRRPPLRLIWAAPSPPPKCSNDDA